MDRGPEETPFARRYTDGQQVHENTFMYSENSTSLAVGEIQTQTTMRYYLIPVRMVIVNKTGNNK